jgi:hypothetical protein
MESSNKNTACNSKLVEKYNIFYSYLAKYNNEEYSEYSLHKWHFGNEIVYSLYAKNKKFMVLIDAFTNLNEANRQARCIIKNDSNLIKILNLTENKP